MGAGTGMFSAAMARWLPVRAVIGIDQSVPMLTQARRAATVPGVHYAAGADVRVNRIRLRFQPLWGRKLKANVIRAGAAGALNGHLTHIASVARR
jgi:hypothetical protein